MKPTQDQIVKARGVYETFFDSYLAGEVDTFASTLDENFEMIGTSESERCHTKEGGIEFFKAQTEEVVGKAEMRNRQVNAIPVEGMVLINELCDIYVLAETDWNFYSKFRISTFLRETPDGWKVVQQHGSLPDMRVQEGETLAIDKISKENLELRDAVKRRTAELENKNRELEIEAALEKVRTLTMAMHNSEDVGKCISKMFGELTGLGVDEGTRFGIGILNHDNENIQLWTASKEGEEVKMHSGNLDMSWHPLLKSARKAWKAQVPLHQYILEGEDLVNYYQMINRAPDYKLQVAIEKLPEREFHYGFVIEHGFFYAFNPREFQPDLIYITKRFSSLFEQTYQRYLDLVKAEAQARESEIQLALERVRARTMAMQKSEELADASQVLYQQVRALGIETWGCAFHIYADNDEGDFEWFSGANGLLPFYKTPREEFFLKFYERGQQGEKFHVEEFKGENCKAHYDFLKTIPVAGDALKALEESGIPLPTYQIDHIAFFNHGHILFITYEPVPKAHDIFQRFAKVFEQTYTRFLDLQKAEAQAREAQIEAALERIRSKAIAMQNTDDIADTVITFFEELLGLGLDKTMRAGIGILSQEERMKSWTASVPDDSEVILHSGFLEMYRHPLLEGAKKAWEDGDSYFNYSLEGEDVNNYFQTLNEAPDFPAEFDLQNLPDTVHLRSYVFKDGLLYTFTETELPDDISNTLESFAAVLGQTYTRYLDLQKAEAQAREAQIEASLERVRSRTMAMQHSDELIETSELMFEQIKNLGVELWSCGFSLWYDNDSYFMGYNTGPDGKMGDPLKIPLTEDVFFTTIRDAKRRGDDFLVFESDGESLAQTYSYMDTLPVVGEFMRAIVNAGAELPKYQVTHCGFFSHGHLMFITEKPSPEAIDIFKRFTKVFDQTYTRFLDLQKAETQAKEAKIEIALEKVRSRTMGMQSSEELPEVANMMFLEVQELGIPAWSCGYCILLEDLKSSTCIMSSEGTLQKPFMLPHQGEVSFEEWDEFLQGEESFFTQELGGKAIDSHYNFMKSLPQLAPVFQDIEDAGLSLPTYQINHLCKFTHGFLLFITYEPVPDAHDIFKRFTKVFDQTYTRFLDLKKAEARAREAQIQSALERVRSHSMGMQNTSDFANVTTEMFNQLRSFGEDLFATGIVFCDKHEGHVEQWHSIPGAGMLSPMIVPIDLDYIHQYRYDQWKAGNALFSVEIPSDFIEQHFQAIFKLPSAQITLKDLESRNAPMPAPPDWEIDYGASFKHGYILVSSLKPIENMDILPRFAQVFEQAYIRFLDLQKAEDQAREAQIEAALEKVRSRTLAMQKSDELAETSVVVFKELLKLGIEPNRLFIGIVKDNAEAVDAWATNEDGSKIEQHFTLYTSRNKSIKKMVEGWKQQQKSAIIDMEGEELAAYFHYLNKVMHIPFIDGLKQKRRVQSIAYFSGGLIGMASPKEQPEETINLLERFAAVFNLTYTRFKDLKIAEAQARQAEKDLINLQKAKKNAENALAELQTTQKQLIQSEKMASLGELTAGIAHEIQNPLNFVNNFSEVSNELIDEMNEELDKGDLEEVKLIAADIKQNLEKINHHGKRADGIVKGMLQHSRSSTGQKEPTDINALADEYLRLAYHGLRAKDKSFNAELVTDFDAAIGKVNVIPQDIGRVILNLITNAFYAVNEKKQQDEHFKPMVSVSTKKTGDLLKIKVTDNGNGIPKVVVDKIFQPFFTTKPTGQGTGLGLSMSYDIITKGHGGELIVETKEGKCTTFCINLPVTSRL